MWSTLANSPSERQAFFTLLDHYFTQSKTTPTPPSPSSSSSRTASSLSPIPPVPAPASFNSLANKAITTHSTSLANSALKNTQLSSTALQNAGLSKSQAGLAAKFGAKHSEVLAPHLAKAGVESAKSGWSNRGAAAAGGKGPLTPSGLMSSKSIAGGFDTSSGKNFGKTLFASKGPLSSEEARKNVFKEPLATKSPSGARSYAAPSGSGKEYVVPPPVRRSAAPGIETGEGEGGERAEGMYDYEGLEEDDLSIIVGESVIVLEHISEDWWKCRNATGEEGLVPVSYLRKIS